MGDPDGSTVIIIAVLLAMIAMSAYFSATETAFSSLNKIRIKNLANNGNKRAALVLRMCGDYDRLLSTILIGNNIVNIGSASLATVVFTKHYGDFGVTLSTVVMTVMVLIFGEISPKSIAKDMPESFAMFSAPILNVLAVILTPVNFLFMQWKKLLEKLFKVKDGDAITEEEFLTIVEEAESGGGINEREGALIRSAIEFDDLDVADVLTPRVNVTMIEDSDSVEEVEQAFVESGFSRLPVYHETIDNIVGVINRRDFHNEVWREKKPVSSVVKPVVFVSPSMKISRLLRHLQQKKTHIAVVVDEYGGVVGIATMEDVVEELVGEIWDEQDEVFHEFQKLSDSEYRIAGVASLTKMFRLFRIGTEETGISTVSGWVIQTLGKIPIQGEEFTFENLTITITKTDGRRVLEIDVKIQAKK